ncbi:cytochrome P450 [Albimonas sp. CAU 1670]|uniref:cytochrome P450 n=1 Tax=Albimonas sp. CAU 1670 TaxID=3032599 RepID=UPI0023D9857B|nr:cytochrome P450 [Albimonas sp. CAU 1670]MDF2235033.1 cytochrome P450 [Albimonas sp. CAU 1670]
MKDFGTTGHAVSADERAALEREALYVPANPPPPMAKLEASRLLRKVNTVRMMWKGSKNLLDLIHPELAGRRWHVVRAGGETIFTVNDADFARHVLQVNSDAYVKGRLYEIIFSKFLRKSSLTMDGDVWRQRRRLISPAFNARAIKGVEAVVARHVEAMLESWGEAADAARPVDLTHDVGELAMRIAMEAFFSADMGDDPARIGDLMDKVITDAGSPPFADIMNLPGWFPRRSRKQAMGWLEELDAWLYGLIDARLARRDQGEPEAPDLLDILVHAKDEETGAFLDRQSIRNEVLTLFAAGHETTALSFAWGLDRLSREPDWQDRLAAVAAEAEAEAGGPLDPAQARGVALLPAAYDEILRLYPPAFSIGRQAIAADRFEDVEIAPGTRIQIVIGMIHRNPRYWERPGVFDPERFLPAGRAGRHPFAHIPFGGGPRICVGLALARLEGVLLLARALPRFRLAPDGPPPEPVGKITLRTRAPVTLRVARRG